MVGPPRWPGSEVAPTLASSAPQTSSREGSQGCGLTAAETATVGGFLPSGSHVGARCLLDPADPEVEKMAVTNCN
jgi:hypothetical protein